MAVLGIGKKKDKTAELKDELDARAAERKVGTGTAMSKRSGTPITQTASTRHPVQIDEDELTDGIKGSQPYSDEVMLRLVNLIYDPLASLLFKESGLHADEAHLLSLTRINSSKEAWYWAQQIAKEAAYNKYVQKIPCNWPISQVQRVAFLLARRSIPGTCGPGFMLGVGLAQEQNITKSEEPGESDVL